jgi:hypothetical protein
LEQGSKEADPVVEDGSGNGFGSAMNQANQLGIVGVGFSAVQISDHCQFCGGAQGGRSGSSGCAQVRVEVWPEVCRGSGGPGMSAFL